MIVVGSVSLWMSMSMSMNKVATVLVRNENDGGIEDRDETNTSRSRPEILPQIDALLTYDVLVIYRTPRKCFLWDAFMAIVWSLFGRG
jgi:hypothetical protein